MQFFIWDYRRLCRFDQDRRILMHHFAVARKMAEHEPAKSTILLEIFPGAEVKTEEDIKGRLLLSC
jgi:hypothetical protein